MAYFHTPGGGDGIWIPSPSCSCPEDPQNDSCGDCWCLDLADFPQTDPVERAAAFEQAAAEQGHPEVRCTWDAEHGYFTVEVIYGKA